MSATAVIHVPRERLIAAAEAGIKASEFDDATVTRIRHFARTATQIGLAFNNGCPMKALGLTDGFSSENVWAFVRAYDPVLATGTEWPNADGDLQMRSNTIALIDNELSIE